MPRSISLLLLVAILCGCSSRSSDPPPLGRVAPAGLSPRFFAPEGWTWAALPTPGATVRYGVAAPAGAPRGSVLIALPAGERGEVWFETARELIARGYTVWIIDGVDDPSAASRLWQRAVVDVVRPSPQQPLVVLLASNDLPGWSFDAQTQSEPAGLVLIPPGDKDVRARDVDPSRQAMVRAWASVSTTGAGAAQHRTSRTPTIRQYMGTPTLVIGDAAPAVVRTCRASARCRLQPGRAIALYLASDRIRKVRMTQAIAFIERQMVRQAPPQTAFPPDT